MTDAATVGGGVVSLYYFLTMQALYTMDPAVQQVVTVMRALQTVALVFLAYVTVK